jgi:hypothetical protein
VDNLQAAVRPVERRTTAEIATHPEGTIAPLVETNTTTKAELLTRARDAVDAGSRSLHDAAEALGLAKEEHSASQREMAKAVGRSPAWINALLKWRLSGYMTASPFDRPRSRSAAKRSGKDMREPNPDTDDAEASAEKRKAEYAEQEGEPETAAPTGAASPMVAAPSTCRKPSPTEAKGNLRYAIDYWWPNLDDAGKAEMTTYFLEKAGVRVS